jgi:hypothetical protein
MFKWKVSRLGSSKKERTKQRLNNAAVDAKDGEEIYAKNCNNNNKDRWDLPNNNTHILSIFYLLMETGVLST